MAHPLYILDTSALIALIGNEEGAEIVAQHLSNAAMSSVNLAEVVTVLTRQQHPQGRIAQILAKLAPHIIAFDEQQALRVGYLYQDTKMLGLSLGDRACVTLARTLAIPVLTADKIWHRLDIGVEVRMIR